MDPLEASDKAIRQVQTVQTALGGGPTAFVAALFAVAFFALLAWHLWRTHVLTEKRTAEAVQVYAAMKELQEFMESVRVIAVDAARRNRSRSKREARHGDEESEPSTE